MRIIVYDTKVVALSFVRDVLGKFLIDSKFSLKAKGIEEKTKRLYQDEVDGLTEFLNFFDNKAINIYLSVELYTDIKEPIFICGKAESDGALRFSINFQQEFSKPSCCILFTEHGFSDGIVCFLDEVDPLIFLQLTEIVGAKFKIKT